MNTLLTELCSYLGLKPEHTELLNERDTSDVWRQFAIWLLVDLDHGVIRFTKPDSKEHAAINHVARLYAQNCKDRELWEAAVKDALAALDDWDTSAAVAAGAFSADAAVAAAAFAEAAAQCATDAAGADAAATAAANATAKAAATAAEDAAARAAAYTTARAAAYATATAAWAANAAANATARAAAYSTAWAAWAANAAARLSFYKHMADKLLELLQLAPPKETP